jgi:hypothetical protein
MDEKYTRIDPAEIERNAKAELAKHGWRFDEQQVRGLFGRRAWVVIATRDEKCLIGKSRAKANAWLAVVELTRQQLAE